MALLTGGFGVVQSIVTNGLGGRVMHSIGYDSNPATVDTTLGFRGGASEIDYPVWAPLHPEQYNARGICIYLPEPVEQSALDKLVGMLRVLRPATCNITIFDVNNVRVAELVSPSS